MSSIIPFIISALISGICSWVIFLYGPRWGLMDVANGRSSHCGAIPTGAGIGLPLACTFMGLYLSIPWIIWLPVVSVSLFSLVGDRVELSVKIRLIVQILCALMICLGWFYPQGHTSILLLIFFIFFITGTANIYNFMDGINGIAGLTALLGFIFLGIWAVHHHLNPDFVLINIVLAGASAGFLVFNFPKARVFMGDVGSIFIGFFFAVQIIQMSESISDFICLASFLLPFYLDEVTTMAIRLKNRENITKAHRTHMYQLLANELKIPQWKITLGFALFQVLVGLIVFGVQSKPVFFILGIDLFFLAAFIVTTFRIRQLAAHKKLEIR